MRTLTGPLTAAMAAMAAAVSAAAATTTAAPICEDSIGGQPPFNSNDVPCLLGCGTQLAVASGSLLPGSVDTTTIPFCQLDCVRTDASPAQSSAAPGCYSACHLRNQATPENVGWCMYWCVAGYQDLVESVACVPSIAMVPAATTMLGDDTITIDAFTQPAAWASWYLTQTVIPRTGNDPPVPAPTSTAGPGGFASESALTALQTPSGSSSTADLWGWASESGSTRAQLFPPSSTMPVSATTTAPAPAGSAASAGATTTGGASGTRPEWLPLVLGLLCHVVWLATDLYSA